MKLIILFSYKLSLLDFRLSNHRDVSLLICIDIHFTHFQEVTHTMHTKACKSTNKILHALTLKDTHTNINKLGYFPMLKTLPNLSEIWSKNLLSIRIHEIMHHLMFFFKTKLNQKKRRNGRTACSLKSWTQSCISSVFDIL